MRKTRKKRISFDLDGVIADGHHYFFEILDGLREADPQRALHAELGYYSSRLVKYHPNLFLAPEDEGFIITSRKPHSREITKNWLKKWGINLTVIFVDQTGDIDWKNYNAAAKEAAKLKAEAIKKHQIDVHFDNNPIIVKALRELLSNVVVIQVGGEEVIE